MVIEVEEDFGLGIGMKMMTGSCMLGKGSVVSIYRQIPVAKRRELRVSEYRTMKKDEIVEVDVCPRTRVVVV